MSIDGAPLLDVSGLSVSLPARHGRSIQLLDAVDVVVRRGEILGVVGESGSGKTVTALAMTRLLHGMSITGEVWFDGRELLSLSESDIREVRGRDIGMIFQEPRRSLDPAQRVGDQIAAVIRAHRDCTRAEARRQAIEMLDAVQIPEPRSRSREYPHSFSGGMCQRVMLAMALACRPKLLIADEPTTALDVTVQRRMLEMLIALQLEFDLSIILVTHDLGIVAEMCDRAIVMYAGQVVEDTSVWNLFHGRAHPYTEALLEALPQRHQPGEIMHGIPGKVPSPSMWPDGCRFHPRCQYATTECAASPPALVLHEDDRRERCIRFDELGVA